MDDLSKAATLGHNNPPPESPFESIKAKLEDLRVEAGNWLDGAEVKNQSEADELGRLLDMVRKAAKEADEARIAEKKPFDDAAEEVQTRYNTLIGNTKKVTGVAVRMETALKAAIGKWLVKVKAEQDAERERLAREAEELRQSAEIAVASTHISTDIDERDAAIAEADKARQAAIELASANRAKAQAQTGGRAIGLVTTYRPEIENMTTALRHYWADRPESFTDLVIQFAKDDIRSGKRQIPGINVIEESVVR